jgi:hypothetical protein
MLIAETPDSDSISSFAQRLSGMASVGLNAIEFVNENLRACEPRSQGRASFSGRHLEHEDEDEDMMRDYEVLD